MSDSMGTKVGDGRPDPSQEQLVKFMDKQQKPGKLTTSWGAPVWNIRATQSVGPRGPLLLQDSVFIDEMQHFDRERVPPRIVHAKGAGAHGFFEVTNDISKYSKAKLFNTVGKRTPLFVRFSSVAAEHGTPDNMRDVRGFAIKMYTEEGNWDLVGNNSPLFFIRDPILFPHFIHALKRNPKTNLFDLNMFWDFCTYREESVHQVMHLFGDRGIPAGYEHMNGYGGNTFSLMNEQGEFVYCKFHLKSHQGVKNITSYEAAKLNAEDPDYATRTLFNLVETGPHPKWTLFIQVMTVEESNNFRWNPFDDTKIWPHGDFPLIEVGTICLNRNPENYFAEVEQVAYSPSNMPPGIGASPDKMLQGRLFSYRDTHFHRVGPNHAELPINCPYRVKRSNYQQDGLMTYGDNQGSQPRYFPNSYFGPAEADTPTEHKWSTSGEVWRYDEKADNDDFTQPRTFWEKVLTADEKSRMVENIVDSLKITHTNIQERGVRLFTKVSEEMGQMVKERLDSELQSGNRLPAWLSKMFANTRNMMSTATEEIKEAVTELRKP